MLGQSACTLDEAVKRYTVTSIASCPAARERYFLSLPRRPNRHAGRCRLRQPAYWLCRICRAQSLERLAAEQSLIDPHSTV